MAHRLQHRAVRRAGYTAGRGVRALRRAAVGLTLALVLPAGAAAQAPGGGYRELIGSSLASPAGWWGAPGRPGWLPDGDLGTAHPWTLAGLVAGSWSLDEAPRAPARLPSPGVLGAQGALAWSESLVVESGGLGGWEGFEASLARVRGRAGLDAGPGARPRARSEVILTTASRGLRDNALSLTRGDSAGGLRLEAASGERGPFGGVAGAGRDLYAVTAIKVRGRHRFAGSFGHRRAVANLAGGESQEARGESGSGGYRYHGERWRLGATLARGYDRHDSRGPAWLEARRLADATSAAVVLEHAGRPGGWGLRWAWQEGRVATLTDSGPRARSHAHWAAARWRGPLSDGELELALGLGRHSAIDRTVLAPSLAWRLDRAPWEACVTVERLAVPIWADLAPGGSPFLQDTWAGGLAVGARTARGVRARVAFLVGLTRDRALLARVPLESLALRTGWRADPRAYDFGLLVAEARWHAGPWGAGVEAFTLAREQSPGQPRVDPGRGGRAHAEATVTLFGGDLRLRPRLEAAAVGPRESDASPPRALPGYLTFGAGLEVELADAAVRIEGRNLEDRPRPQSWVDGATGSEAVGPGRELRATLVWRLWD